MTWMQIGDRYQDDSGFHGTITAIITRDGDEAMNDELVDPREVAAIVVALDERRGFITVSMQDATLEQRKLH